MDSSSLNATGTSSTTTVTNASTMMPPPIRDSQGRLLPGRTGLNGSVRGPGGRFMKVSGTTHAIKKKTTTNARRAIKRAATTTAVDSTPPTVDADNAMDTIPTAAATTIAAIGPSMRTPQEERQAIIDDFYPIVAHLPAVLKRSLALIRAIDQEVTFHSQEVHARLQLQKAFPSMPATARPDARELRARISFHLERMEFLRRTSVAEASNMVALVRQNMEWLEDARVVMIIRGLVDKIEGRTGMSSREDAAEEAAGNTKGEASTEETAGTTKGESSTAEAAGTTKGEASSVEGAETAEGEGSGKEAARTDDGEASTAGGSGATN